MPSFAAPPRAVPTRAHRADEMRLLDARLARHAAIDDHALMQQAGRAAFFRLRRRWPQARRLGVVCGPGNNGGDGFVVAGLARTWGLAVELWAMSASDTSTGAARRAAEDFRAAGGVIRPLAADALRTAAVDVWIDALFGIGLARPLTEMAHAAVVALNQHPAPILAIDVPSGLSADTGAILGAAVQAAATVSFIAPKPGLYTGAGPDCCGEVWLDALGAPADLDADLPGACRLWPAAMPLGALLPPRPPAAHKGRFGHVLVIGGGPGMAGAARMGAEAALRAGAGLVSVATAPAHAAMLGIGRPELMVTATPSAAELAPLLARSTVRAIGPGLGRDAWAERMFDGAVSVPGPLVVDADGLNLLAAAPRHRGDWILTPHPAEAARLLGVRTTEVQADRLAAVRALTERYGGVALLKGAGTLIDDGRQIDLCEGANPGLASGGMGDVLTGLIAGLLAQGLSPADAARGGVRLQLHAAAQAARDMGTAGMLAGDVLARIAPFVTQWGSSHG